MATKKNTKTRSARPAGKKGIAKKAGSRSSAKPIAKTAPKRTRKATASSTAARARVLVVPPAEPLFRAAELDGVAVERKPARKAEPARPARPPARLPIPQSTYFF
jgi:hypothetical protein